MDLISVIVPIYNVEQYLERCIESLLNQSYKNLEIILVDDGSPDRCPQMCDEWAQKDARIRVIHKENGGLSDARNAGMKIASGEFIGFVDSDDWIASEMYQYLKAALDRDQSDIAACAVETIWEDGSTSRLLTVRENCVLNRLEAQAALLEESKLKQPVWYKLYRRSVINGIPFEKGKYHEDVFWSYRIMGNANRVSLIDYVGYFYWQRRGSIMGGDYSLRRLDAIEAYRRRYEYLKENFPILEKKARISILTGCIYHGQMALRYLPQHEQAEAFAFLEETYRNYPLSSNDYSEMKLSRRVWFGLAAISLKSVCKIKNHLKIGL